MIYWWSAEGRSALPGVPTPSLETVLSIFLHFLHKLLNVLLSASERENIVLSTSVCLSVLPLPRIHRTFRPYQDTSVANDVYRKGIIVINDISN